MTQLSYPITCMLRAAANSGLPIIITGKQGTGKSTLAKAIVGENIGKQVVEIGAGERISKVLNRLGNAVIVVNGFLEGEDVQHLSYVSIKCYSLKDGRKQAHFIPVERSNKKSYDRLSTSVPVLVVKNSSELDLEFNHLKSRNIKTIQIRDKSDIEKVNELIELQQLFNYRVPEIQLPAVHVAVNMEDYDIREAVGNGLFSEDLNLYKLNMYVTLHYKSDNLWSPNKLCGVNITPNMITTVIGDS